MCMLTCICVMWQYPKELPYIYLTESKGLDEQRQKHLLTSIQDKAFELSSCLMLVALCEEAVQKLSVMNHPDGDCPLCLYPLVVEDERGETLPFMKLMSCFHCFHSQCIKRWWNWLQKETQSNNGILNTTNLQPIRDMEYQNDMHGRMEGSMGNCPVCRKVFQAKDLEHVIDLVGTCSSQSSPKEAESSDDKELLQSDSEKIRRQKFDAILKLQGEKGGLIERKRDLVVLPGMFLPQPVFFPAQPMNRETIEHHQSDHPTVSEQANISSSSYRPVSNYYRNSDRRKHRQQNPRSQVKQWVRKENNAAK
uniref:RING-type domain-containing protein n=1 Tax=Rhizophora mucronata TaxID=61149 RepID=A0A2P2L6L0_RHIMU